MEEEHLSLFTFQLPYCFLLTIVGIKEFTYNEINYPVIHRKTSALTLTFIKADIAFTEGERI